MKNMKNKIFLGALALTMLAGTTSCGDDFLKEDSGHMVTDGLLETGEGAKAMAAGLYGNIRWHFGYEWAYGITLYGTDEFTNGADLTAEPWNTYDTRLNSMDCTPATGAANKNCPPVSGLWDQMYYGISTANLIISKADLIANEDDRNKAAGEAYFLRGYNLFRLFAQYGAVVVQTEPAEGVNQVYTRATEEETLNQVIADFEEAYNRLPTSKWRGNGTWTKYTAAHFLAKALLFRQSERCDTWNSGYSKDTDLNKVISLANEVIAACPLTPDYNDLYANWTGIDCKNEGLSEILMTAEHNEDGNTGGRFGNRTYNYFNPQFSNFSGGYVQRGQYIGGMDFQRCRPTEYTYSIFDNVNDARMWKTFKTIYGYNNYTAPSKMLKGDVPDSKAPELGDIGIMFILNKKDDPRFQDETTYGTFGRGAVEHTFVHPETDKWVPNVFPVYLGGKYVLNTYGVSGNPATSNVFCGINKTDDGSRTAEKGDAHRDVIMARTGETYLVKAEAQVRLGKYQDAIATVNELRARGQWKEGEDREYYVDGSIAFKNNSTASASLGKCKDENGVKLTNLEAYNVSFIQKNTYYVSTGIERTTEASDLQIESYTKLPAEDEAVLAALNVSGDEERMIHFILNERTRELLGEWNRWEELSRTKTLVQRAKLYNPEAAPNVAEKHLLRPIPQKFIDSLVDENGNNLSDSDKAAWQNPGW
ncbi:MAG: RagB/SusD family nutrient uptake outer membrane protein [Mediterranea massiliensis]|nr:RagB/SusD family nutrient uptake outer membrane protein [Mediterranea massiliensis]